VCRRHTGALDPKKEEERSFFSHGLWTMSAAAAVAVFWSAISLLLPNNNNDRLQQQGLH